MLGQGVIQESRSRDDGFGFSRSNGTWLGLPPKIGALATLDDWLALQR